MSKGNNQRGRYNALNIRLAKYVALVQAVYDTLNQQAANIAMMTGYDGSKEFHFSDFPQVREAVQRLQQDYVQSMHAIIYRGTSDEWKQSNLVQDLLADKILGKYSSKSWGRKHEVYYQTNSDALKAFQQRKDNGMGLSQRIWNMSGNYKEELEYSISTAIQKGTSAVQLSKKLSKYLNDFPSLKKDYKEKYGKAVDCHDCEYRSIRLARSEINMAYRSAEQTRWMQMDFVLGYEIKLSKKHKKDSDICDDLAGQYPKDFVWTGWHPNDLCYVIPILKTEEEFWHDEDTPPINQTKPVTEFPSGFNEYMESHLDKISISNQKGTLSYWLRDNEDVKGCALLMNKAKQVGNVVQDIAERIAGEHGAIVTPINYKGFASLYRKVHYADQYGVRTALTEVKDSVRNTIVLDGDLNSVIKDLAKDSHWLRTKVQTADKFCGYSGNIVNLTMDNGVVAEIQVNTPKMIFAKESERHARAILGDELYDKIAKETGMEGGLGHKLYEQIRVLDRVADAEKKAALEKQMKEYYSHFNGIGEKIIVYREFKTIKECNAYADQFPFIGKMDYGDCPVHIANRINKRLTELYEMHMVPDDVDEKISVTTFFSKKQKNGSYLGGSYNHVGACKMNIAYNGDRIRNRIIDKERRDFLKVKEEQLNNSYHNLSELEKDVTERSDWFSPELLQMKRNVLKRFKEYMPQLLENIEQEKKNWKPKLFSCARSVEDNFTHEFGHYVEDMIQKNWDKFSDDVHDAIKKLCAKYGYDGGNGNNLIFLVERNLFDKAAWGAEGRMISDYAGTNGAEYFAEAFLTYYQKGDTGNKELNDLFKILFKK